MHNNNAVCIIELFQVNMVNHTHYLPECTFCLLRQMTFSEEKKKPRKIKWNQNLDFYSTEILLHTMVHDLLLWLRIWYLIWDSIWPLCRQFSNPSPYQGPGVHTPRG